MLHDRIQDRQDLPHACGQRDLNRLPGSAQPLIERPDHGIAPRRRHSGHVQHGPDLPAATADAALATPGAAVAIQWRDPHQGGDRAAVERPQFRQRGQHGSADNRADTRHTLQQVILLDALYGGEKAFDDFIGSGKRAKHHKLIAIGSDTAEESSAFAKKYPFAVVRDRMPDASAGFSKREKSAKLLYVKSQYGHMQIVTGGKVIPVLLRLTPLKHL